jgi:hypothetical protein
MKGRTKPRGFLRTRKTFAPKRKELGRGLGKTIQG